ncbi:hypothetical protein RAA17_10700 [Komagataeibacter rhaeticus]|nr:hypothetical protein [Komagataeibacter rhaeticus]
MACMLPPPGLMSGDGIRCGSCITHRTAFGSSVRLAIGRKRSESGGTGLRGRLNLVNSGKGRHYLFSMYDYATIRNDAA